MAERGKPKHREPADDQGSQAAEYIAELTDELAKLARRSKLDLLAYLLDIASLEARTSASRLETATPKVEKPSSAEAIQG